MSTSVPYQVPYKNQLQFNLGVPLTTQNLAVQFSRPSPIFVERVGGQHGLPMAVAPRQSTGAEKSGASAFNYSTLSQDKMEMMSQLAKRDLRNRRLQSQISSSESPSPASSPSRTRLHQKTSCQRFTRQEVAKPRKPLTAKETDRNRRLGAVQTPPPRKPAANVRRDNYFTSVKNASVNMAADSSAYFPAKGINSDEPKDEIDRLHEEAEGYLSLIELIQERAVSAPGGIFIPPPIKGSRKDEYLLEEENLDRVRIRVEEQNTRLTRNLYNLKLKVKQVENDVSHADLSQPVRKSQILSQLGIVYRGTVKALQTCANQLPYVDLKGGLPSHFQDLSSLLRQLTALHAVVKAGKPSNSDQRLLAVLERVDNLNTKWSAEPKKVCFQAEKKAQKPAIIKDWVSDTKVDKNIFVMKTQPDSWFPLETSKLVTQALRQPMQRGRPKKRSAGKENQITGAVYANGKGPPLELRSAIASLLQSKPTAGGIPSRELFSNGDNIALDTGKGRQPVRQEHMKGYLLPHDLVVKREKAQRALALSNQDRRYADPTLATSLKKSPCRPNSAPANARHKEVSFDLDRQSSSPWIPPGRSARSRSLSSEPKSRSRSPFYLSEVDSEDVRKMFPEKQSAMVTKAHSSDFRNSLPTDRKLRSADVSNSFIDEVEHRLLRRLMGKEAGKKETAFTSNVALRKPSHRKETLSADTTGNVYSEEDMAGGVYSDEDGPLDATDLGVVIGQEAASVIDGPTLENMKQRLKEMQREQSEIRQRWSSLKFTDTKPESRIFAYSDIQSDRFVDPPAIEVTKMSNTERPGYSQRFVSKEWSEEPMIFTKPRGDSKVKYLHTVVQRAHDDLHPEPLLAQIKSPKRLVTLKQTAVERIVADREQFERYLRKRSHHPSGKFDPWKLVEEISDEILSDCLTDVATEVETINEEIANHVYKAEFMVDTSDPGITPHRERAEADLSTGLHPAKLLTELPANLPLKLATHLTSETAGNIHKPNKVYQVPIDYGMVKEATKGISGKVVERKNSLFDEEKQQEVTVEDLQAEGVLSVLNSASGSPDKLSPVISGAEPLLEDVFSLLRRREDLNLRREERGDGEGEIEERGGGDVVKEEGGKLDSEYEGDEESSKAASDKSGGDDGGGRGREINDLEDDDSSVGGDDDDDGDEDDYGSDNFEDDSDQELKDVKYDESEASDDQ